jgi:hypothetical protein
LRLFENVPISLKIFPQIEQILPENFYQKPVGFTGTQLTSWTCFSVFMNMNIIPGAFQFELALTKVMIIKIRLNWYPL